VPVLKSETHLPVFGRPESCGRHLEIRKPACKSRCRVGADDYDRSPPHPEAAYSDGAQSLKYSKFEQLMKDLKPIAEAVGRTMG